MSDAFLDERLRERAERGALRRLRTENNGAAAADFSSNDYLGIVRRGLLDDALAAAAPASRGAHGSTGSRLLTGNCAATEDLERAISAFHGAPAGLVFNSGYDANLGIFGAVPADGDLVLYDEWVHASIRDGIRLGHAASLPFRHNDLRHLEERLAAVRRGEGDGESLRRPPPAAHVFVAVESVYSMDGDVAPLRELAGLCGAHGARLVVDEAHATGIFGAAGRGVVDEAGIAGDAALFARLHTFGKALGAHGAIVLGSAALREYLINFAHSFIYTTALPPESIRAIAASYRVFPELERERARLRELIAYFHRRRERCDPRRFRGGEAPIQALSVTGNDQARALAEALLAGGIDARPILSPTVRRGTERLRVCLHAFNTEEEIDRFFRIVEARS